MASNTVVITGGNGFVGQWLQRELKNTHPDWQVVSWDLPGIDITRPETYASSLQDLQPDWIIHLAALSAVGTSWQDPTAVITVNVAATRQLLAAAKTVSPKTTFLVASSADIYGSVATAMPLVELPLLSAKPVSPYAKSKWEMEKLIAEQYNDRVIRVRAFPHTGPGQRQGFVVPDFAAQIAAIETKQQPAVMRVGNLEAKRDISDVRDVVRAYALLLTHGTLGEVYHVASGKAVAISEVLKMLLDLSQVKIDVQQDPTKLRPIDVPVLVGDANKLKAATGWSPEISLEQTLKDTLDFWRNKTLA